MQTIVNGYTIEHPEAMMPIFNPCLFKVSSSELNANNPVTTTITCGDVTMKDIRYVMDGVFEIDIATYLHALFANYRNDKVRHKAFTVRFEQTTIFFTLDCVALFSYSSPAMPLGKSVRQRFYTQFFGENKVQMATILKDASSTVTVSNVHTLSGGAGYMDIKLLNYWLPNSKNRSIILHTDNGDVDYKFIPDESTEGTMLKWLDAQGFYRFFLFTDGEREISTKDNGVELPIYFEGTHTIGTYNGRAEISQGVKIESTKKLCAVLSDEEDRELLDTIYTATMVWIVTAEGDETPVRLARGKVATTKGLQDYEIEITLQSPLIISL